MPAPVDPHTKEFILIHFSVSLSLSLCWFLLIVWLAIASEARDQTRVNFKQCCLHILHNWLYYYIYVCLDSRNLNSDTAPRVAFLEKELGEVLSLQLTHNFYTILASEAAFTICKKNSQGLICFDYLVCLFIYHVTFFCCYKVIPYAAEIVLCKY